MNNKEIQDRTNHYRGKFFWKERWFSICSGGHFDLGGYDKNCDACNAGHWTNVWKWKIGGLIFDLFPNLWRKWMNRPNSKARKRLKEIFPKL